MKITTLIENQAPDSLCREHGLAVHMEYKGKIIFWTPAPPDSM